MKYTFLTPKGYPFSPNLFNVKKLVIFTQEHTNHIAVNHIQRLITDNHNTICREFPENKDHPVDQVKWAKSIINSINEGSSPFEVYTHSDWIIRAINIAITLYHKPEAVRAELMKEFGYTEQDLISKDDVGCYLITTHANKPNTFVVKECEITEEYGIEAEAFNPLISKMMEEQDMIIYRAEPLTTTKLI